MLTYRDYRAWIDQQAGSEGQGTVPLTEEEWNALSPEQQLKHYGSGQLPIRVSPGDPRYAALKERVGGEPGRDIWLTREKIPERFLVDPSKQVDNDGWFARSEDNETPEYQDMVKPDGSALRMFLLSSLGMLAGGLATGAFSGPFGGVDMLAAAPGQGFGTASANGAASLFQGAGNVASAGTELTGGDLPHGTEAPNTYSPNADPTRFHVPQSEMDALERLAELERGLGASEQGGFEPHGQGGGDYPAGTEMPNHYAPGADPTSFYVPGGVESSWIDTLTNGVRNFFNDPSRVLGAAGKIPGLVNAISAGDPAGGPGGGGLGPKGGTGMGGYSPAARRPELDMNPYAKQEQPQLAGMLHDLLKGVAR